MAVYFSVLSRASKVAGSYDDSGGSGSEEAFPETKTLLWK